MDAPCDPACHDLLGPTGRACRWLGVVRWRPQRRRAGRQRPPGMWGVAL